MYTSFRENSFTPLLGNVDANNICLNELSKDVSSVQENVWSISQKVHKMSQAVYPIEKNMDVRCSKELTQLRGDFISLCLRVSEFIDLCQQVACFESLCHRTADDSPESMSNFSSHNIVSKVDGLETSMSNLGSRLDNIDPVQTVCCPNR